MEQEQLNGNMSAKWNYAALDGLILASVTVVTTLVNLWISNPIVSFLCWSVKTAGSIWLLLRFMRRFASERPGESVFGYGVMVCLFSSIVCAAFGFVYYEYLFPDKMAEAMDQARQLLSQQALPSEAEDALNRIEDNASKLACVSNLLWGFLYGVLLSAILRRPASLPVDIFKNEEDEEL